MPRRRRVTTRAAAACALQPLAQTNAMSRAIDATPGERRLPIVNALDAQRGARLGSGCAQTAGSPVRPSTWPQGAPPNFHLMAKPTGAVCNLDCKYCFFLSKEAL